MATFQTEFSIGNSVLVIDGNKIRKAKVDEIGIYQIGSQPPTVQYKVSFTVNPGTANKSVVRIDRPEAEVFRDEASLIDSIK